VENENEAPAETPNEPASLLSGNQPVELGEGEYFLSDGVKGQGDAPEWYMGDKYKSVADQAKGYSELQKKFGSFTGTPKDGYTLPEGVEEGDELYKQLQEFATESNMSQDGMAKAWELLSAQSGVNEEISKEAEMAKLGDNAQERINQLDNALKFKLGDKYGDVADLVTDANGVLLAEALVKSFQPVKLPIDGGEHPQGLVWADVEKEMFKKDENGRLLRSTDQAHNAKVERMMKEFGGDKEHKLVVG